MSTKKPILKGVFNHPVENSLKLAYLWSNLWFNYAFRIEDHLCQSTKIGLAIKIEEYVPAMIPMNKASTKYFIVTPPNKNKASRTNKTVSEVFKDLTTV